MGNGIISSRASRGNHHGLAAQPQFRSYMARNNMAWIAGDELISKHGKRTLKITVVKKLDAAQLARCGAQAESCPLFVRVAPVEMGVGEGQSGRSNRQLP